MSVIRAVAQAVAGGGGGGGGAWEYLKSVTLSAAADGTVDLGVTVDNNEVVKLVGVDITRSLGGSHTELSMQLSNNSETTDYAWHRIKSVSSSTSVTADNSTTSGDIKIGDLSASGVTGGYFDLQISKGDGSWATVQGKCTIGFDLLTDESRGYDVYGMFKQTAAITEVTLLNSDNSKINGIVHVYRLITA